jgi:putative transposase
VAFVLLPEHFHCIWKLPENDCDYSIRLGRIKKRIHAVMACKRRG